MLETKDVPRERAVADDSFKALQRVPEKLKDFHFSLKDIAIDGNEHTVAILQQNGVPAPDEAVVKEFVYFYQTIVRKRGSNLNRRDCVDVAQQAIGHFSNVGVVEMKSIEKSGTSRKFFKHFTHHVFNLFIRSEQEWMIADFTAGHTMDADQGNYDILLVVGRTERDAEMALRVFHNTEVSG